MGCPGPISFQAQVPVFSPPAFLCSGRSGALRGVCEYCVGFVVCMDEVHFPVRKSLVCKDRGQGERQQPVQVLIANTMVGGEF